MAVWSGRAKFSRVSKVFAAYAFVYLLPAGVTALSDAIGGPQCFDQRRGEARLFYSIEQRGTIVLSDVPGFDRFGVKRKPVTADICYIADRQKRGVKPTRITGNLQNVEFFDAAGGGALVFYSRGADGRVDLFDGPGVNPVTNAILAPVTADVVEEIKKAVEVQEQQRADAEKRRLEEEARTAAEIARQQAEAEKARAEQEETAREAEAARVRQIEEDRVQKLEAQQREKERLAQDARDRQRRQQEAEAQAQIESAQRIDAANRAAAAARGCTASAGNSTIWVCPGTGY